MYRFFISFNIKYYLGAVLRDKKMLTSIKKDLVFNECVYFQDLPSDIKLLIQSVSQQQRHLSALLSSSISLQQSHLTLPSLSVFIEEIYKKLELMILSFDELICQVDPTDFSLNKPYNIEVHRYPSIETNISLSKDLHQFYTITYALLEKFSRLYIFFSEARNSFFLQFFSQKSLLFYKQTCLVLQGHIRVSKGKNC